MQMRGTKHTGNREKINTDIIDLNLNRSTIVLNINGLNIR